MTTEVINEIKSYLRAEEQPQRMAISRRFPLLKRPVIATRHLQRKLSNARNPHLRSHTSSEFFGCVVARHQSVLRRKLGSSDPRLQERKVTNLTQAIKKLNGVIINPGDIFSLWEIIGKPTYDNGYVDGMLISDGKVIEGIGGGLCQLSNFLFWIFLHAPAEIIERHHHSKDVFPDSGRTLPFGSGATILYNYLDLKIKNTSDRPLQLNLWLTDKHLKGQILAPLHFPVKYGVHEKDHCYVKRGSRWYRFNKLYRTTRTNGVAHDSALITTNFAPILYPVTDKYIESHNFTVLDFTNHP